MTGAGRRHACGMLAGAGFALGLQACSSGRTIPTLPGLKENRLSARWSIGLGESRTGFWPAYAAGSVWAADASGRVLRVDPRRGDIAWSRDLDRRLVCGVGTDGTLVAAAGRDGSLIALSAAGEPAWRISLGADVVTVPAVDGEVVVVRTSDNRLQAFDATTGRRRWVYARQNPTLVLKQTSTMLIQSGVVYAGMPAGRIVALAAATGAVRWEASVSLPRGSNEIERISDVLGSPLAIDGAVCGASYQGKVACFETANGRARWGTDFRAVGGIAHDGERIYATDDDGNVAAIDRRGAIVWRQRGLAGRRLAGPGRLGATLLVGDEEGYVHALATSDGQLIGRVATDGTPVLCQPREAGDVAVVQTRGGRLVGLTAR